jgi:hypothetical protein
MAAYPAHDYLSRVRSQGLECYLKHTSVKEIGG